MHRDLHHDNSLLPYERLLAEHVTAAVVGCRTLPRVPDGEWPDIVTAAVRHGVAQPLAALTLAEPAVAIPSDVRSVLSRLLEGNRARNLAVYTEIEHLLACLAEAVIEPLVLKGVALSLSVYPDLAHRNFADVDILVPGDQMDRANTLLLAQGWRLQHRESEPSHHHVEYERRLDVDILTATVAPEFDASLTADRLAPHTHRLRLEVHRSPFYDVSGSALATADLEAFREDAGQALFPSGVMFRVPSPEAMLVHLCAHAGSHVFQKAQFPLDVALVLRRFGDRLDPAVVASLAVRYGATRHVRVLLDFVSHEFGMDQARPVIDAVGSPSGRPLTWRAIFEASAADKVENRLRQWSAAGTSKERLVGAIRAIFPTPAVMRRIYHSQHPALLPGLYLWRPLQLTGRLARTLARASLRPLLNRRKECR